MTLEEMSRQMRLKEYEEEVKYLESIMDDIKELDKKPVVIKESVFKEFFLPYIDGTIPVSKESIAAFTHNMLQLTNSYFIPIQVVDDITGEELFMLPPYMYELKESDLVKYLNYNKLIQEYNALKASVAQRADNILEARLKEIEKILQPDDSNKTLYMENILKIYKRYGLLDKDNKEVNNNLNDDDLDIEY